MSDASILPPRAGEARGIAPDDSAPPPRPPQRATKAPAVRNLRMLRTIGALVLREMSTTYGKSSLGYLWALAEPIAGILLVTFFFTLALKSPSLGTNFPLFYATGIMTFAIWSSIAGKVGSSIKFSRQLIAYPGVTFIDAMLARLLLNVLTQTMVAYIIYGSIISIYALDVTLRIEWIVLGLALCFTFATGVGVFNAYMKLAFPWYGPTYAVVTRPLFLISCVIFIWEEVPAPYNEWLLWNPIVHIIGIVRRGFYVTYDADWASPLFVLGASMLGMMVGLALLRRDVRIILDR